MPSGTLINLIGIETKVMRSVPIVAWNLFSEHLLLTARSYAGSKNRVKIKRVERDLRDRFGIEMPPTSNNFLPSSMEQRLIIQGKIPNLGTRSYELSRDLAHAREFALGLIDAGEDSRYHTEDHVRSVFNDYEIEELVDFLPETTFILDELRAQAPA